ncbi:MAG: twin-arginine translocation signal domain-containing protein [Deltaproteobacteria bacterium]
MENSRRKFLKTLAAGAIGGEIMTALPGNVLAKKEPSGGGFEIQKGFRVFNEVTQKNMLKLAEAFVPGSEDIGIKEKVMNLVRNDKGAAGFLDAGFWNIDALSRAKFDKPFYALENKEDIDRIIKHVSVRNRTFFLQFKGIVMKFYYSDPSVWKKLSYQGPPQPRGFMDYTEAPKKQGG